MLQTPVSAWKSSRDENPKKRRRKAFVAAAASVALAAGVLSTAQLAGAATEHGKHHGHSKGHHDKKQHTDTKQHTDPKAKASGDQSGGGLPSDPVVGGHVGGGQQVPSALEGFAAVSGAGHGPTTGGSGGPTVTVTSLAQLQTAAARSGPEVIKVNGLFSGRGGSRWPPTRPSSAWAPTPGSPASACR